MNRFDFLRSRSARIALFSAAALAVAGCDVDTKKEVAVYRQILDGQSSAVVDYKPGQPLSLEAALLLANQNDEALASSGENYLQALIARDRAFSAFLPTISLAPVYTWYDRRGGGLISPNGVVSAQKQGQFDTPVTGSANLFNGFRDVANVRRTGFTADQQKALLLDAQQTTFLNVAQAYYAVLTYERSVTVLLNTAQVQNERVRDMQGRLKAGIARPLDVAQSDAQAAATRVSLIQAQNNVRTSRIALAFLVNNGVQDAALADNVNVPDALPTQDDLVKVSLRARQDLQAAEQAVESSRQAVHMALAEYYPSISINLDYFLTKQSIATVTNWESVLQANLPLYTGGTIQADVRTAWSQLRQAWLNEQRVRRTISEQVRTALENIVGSKKRLVDLHIEVKAAFDALMQAEFSYNAGLGTNLDVLTAQDALLTARLSLVTEQLNFKLYYLQLLRAEGRMPLPLSPEPGKPATTQPEDEMLTIPTTPPGFSGMPASAPATQPTTAPATQTQPAPAPTTQPTPSSGPSVQP